MNRWPVERRWLVQTESGSHLEVLTDDLLFSPVCCLLGPAGSGKTFELKHLEQLEIEAGDDVRSIRLAEVASTSDRMIAHLDKIAAEVTSRTTIHLDALDEAMIPIPTTALILPQWIRDRLVDMRPRLRLSCRSAVWPKPVLAALAEVYGEDSVTVATLQLLDEADVLRVAEAEGIDGAEFHEQVSRANVGALASQPLTLKMLLGLYKDGISLSTTNRGNLFSRAINRLVLEREERRDLCTESRVSPSQIVEAAECLACFTVLSGAEVVDLTDEPDHSSLACLDLSLLPSFGKLLDVTSLKAVGLSGLCEGAGVNRFRFVHRQIAEYLAGRRLAKLPFHQSRSLFCSGLGWKAGVAGPVRETVAFAAIENAELAQWLAEYDPEVIGLSDVANDQLRRLATLRLLERFRRRELTDSLLDREDIPLEGLRYAGVEDDLRPLLMERDNECEDLIDIVIRIVESWHLDFLHDELADLALDPRAPLRPRIAAGYVLKKSGSREARSRLKPLVAGSPKDPDDELKGIALCCCWPEHLSMAELFDVLEPWGDRTLHGAYFGFLLDLDRSGFDASGDCLRGLRWARTALRRYHSPGPDSRIIQRISHASLGRIEDKEIAMALADLLWESSKLHNPSPLEAITADWSSEGQFVAAQAPLASDARARRVLIEHLVQKADDRGSIWMVAHESPGLLILDDFSWLLERACDPFRPMPERELYAEIAGMLPSYASIEAVECWLRVRDQEPVKSVLNYAIRVDLDSDEARQAKRLYSRQMAAQKPARKKRGVPSPEKRVQHVIGLSEQKDPRFFFDLCRDLTLEAGATHYEFQRFLTKTPGWGAADNQTRGRILDAAKRVLDSPTDAPEACRDESLNSILVGYMAAIWLTLEEDPSWLEGRPTVWWERWGWYILRELHPRLAGEAASEKIRLLQLLYRRTPSKVRRAIIDLARGSDQESQTLLTGLLELSESICDRELDAELGVALQRGEIGPDRTWHVACFLLGRDPENAKASCRACLYFSAQCKNDDIAVEVAVALLAEQTPDAWGPALGFIRERPDLAKPVIERYSQFERRGSRDSGSDHPDYTIAQAAQLFEMLLEHYPPENDTKHQGAYWESGDDSAVMLRDRLINWLGSQKSVDAVEVLKRIESRFGTRYPWLRRPRSAVERAYRQYFWTPIPPEAVASLLVDGASRLIRSEEDALDGVVEAIEQFQSRLRNGSPAALEDLWNTPRKGPPSPKEEERISDKLCEAIRQYFKRYAVVADREVQVFRRNVPRDQGGAPGSEVDVLVSIPGRGTAEGIPIAIPVEVKRSCNSEAKTGMRDQLCNRYMRQCGTNCGAFVVVWLDAPGLAPAHQPVWSDFEQARKFLAGQADEIIAEGNGAFHLRTFVVDASLDCVPKATDEKDKRRGASRGEAKRTHKKGRLPNK